MSLDGAHDYRLLTVGPSRVSAGVGALGELGAAARRAGARTTIVTGKLSWPVAERPVRAALDESLRVEVAFYGDQVSERAVDSLCHQAQGADSLIGVGGGKALDAAKLVAHRLGVPVFTVPTSSATCAAWTALSNVYSEEGGWLYGVPLAQAPQGVFVDHDLVLDAPCRLLASGVADAMAKWYESDSAVDPNSADATTAAALELSHYLHKQLVRHAKAAVGGDRAAAVRVVDLNVLLAGTVSGLGGPMCRSVAAHAVANGLTHLSDRSLHGEKVAFGLLTQFVLQDRALSEIEEFIGFLADLQMPLTLRSQGLPDTAEGLARAVQVALDPTSSIHRLEVPLDEIILTRAMLEADALARRSLKEVLRS